MEEGKRNYGDLRLTGAERSGCKNQESWVRRGCPSNGDMLRRSRKLTGKCSEAEAVQIMRLLLEGAPYRDQGNEMGEANL